jgi:hypothetical protein
MSRRSLALLFLLLVALNLSSLTHASPVDEKFDDDEFEFSTSSVPPPLGSSSYEDEAEVDSSSGVIEEDDCKPLAPPGTSGHGTPRSQFREIIREKLGATLESTGNRNRSMTSRLERMQANQDYR